MRAHASQIPARSCIATAAVSAHAKRSSVPHCPHAGAVANSVNFPNTALAPLSRQHTRLCLINQNRPGMIGRITSLLGERGVNIAQQAHA